MKFKYKKDMELYFALSLELQMIAADMAIYSRDVLNKPFIITETLTDIDIDKRYQRVSSSHREGRAIDISLNWWTKEDAQKFTDHFNSKYVDMAAISGSTLKPTLCVYGDKRHLSHIHVQVHKKFAIKK